jgi:hypothetical protein
MPLLTVKVLPAILRDTHRTGGQQDQHYGDSCLPRRLFGASEFASDFV